MARRKMTENLINLESINEKITYIENSDDYYISENGNVYREYEPNLFFPKKNYINPANNYLYCGISYNGEMKTVRVHRLVATYFVENDNHSIKEIVGHKDNNKQNNVYTNLYWTTTQENTQKSFDDKLQINASGFDDSQSLPVCVFNINKNFIEAIGSCTLASKKYNVSKSTVCRQCKHEIKTKPRCGYYFRYKDEYDEKGFVL